MVTNNDTYPRMKASIEICLHKEGKKRPSPSISFVLKFGYFNISTIIKTYSP